MIGLRVSVNPRELRALERITPAIRRSLSKAGTTALRDMRSEASKRIRQRKRIKARYVAKALQLQRPRKVALDSEWTLLVRGTPVPLIAYPARQTKRGVSVEVNRGKRSFLKGAFIATMKTGHKGVFVRKGKARLPIRELYGSRPVDALLHEGEAQHVQERGRRAFVATFERLLPLELAKGKGGGGGAT